MYTLCRYDINYKIYKYVFELLVKIFRVRG